MDNGNPCVTIGMPVYNGERFLRRALDSILAQTFKDFELIISDNASTDGTGKICQEYANRDKRIRYSRNEDNLGAAPNYNLVFNLSRGRYFKWAAHDDVCAPEFLERCVEILEQDESVVLCHPKAKVIDEHGAIMGRDNELYDFVKSVELDLNTDSVNPEDRFRSIVGPHPCYQVFGVVRSSALKLTPLIESYASSDRVLLARLCLLGRFHEVPEYLFFPRRHVQQSIQTSKQQYNRYAEWFNTDIKQRFSLPRWQLLAGFLSSINQSSLQRKQKVTLYFTLIPWIKKKKRGLLDDLIITGLRLLRIPKNIIEFRNGS
ncbi:MAG: glycosyltransferase family A protein [Cyanobacteria bacterium P01_F01_bin.150]